MFASLKLEFWMAWRYLKNVRREGFISVSSWFSFIGIALGVATLIIVLSVMNGFRTNLLDRILGVQGHFTVEAKTSQAYGNFDSLRQDLLKLGKGDIIQLSPLISGQVLATSKHASDGILIRSLPAAEIQNRKLLTSSLLQGKWENFDEIKGLYIGARLANRLRVGVGDNIKLIAPKFSRTGFGSVPRTKTYKVGGIFEVGMFQYDNNVAFMPVKEARRFFQLKENQFYSLEGLLKNTENAAALTNIWQAKIGNEYKIRNWQDNNHALVSALKVERNVMFIILTLIILVAAFNIIAGQVMLVKNKSRAIALLRSFGAKRAMVLRIFLICGSLIGIAGTAVGAIAGIIFALNIERISNLIENIWNIELFSSEIYFLSELPSQVEIADVALVCIMSVIISLAAACYPATKAAKISPAEELRYE